MIDTKENFRNKILEYYTRSNNEDYFEKIQGLVDYLSRHFHNQYKDFSRMYPKSSNRYSKFDTKDLENPLTHDLIINYLKENHPNIYFELGSMLLQMSEQEFKIYEKKRNNFESMF